MKRLTLLILFTCAIARAELKAEAPAATANGCLIPDGSFVIDDVPKMVRWEYANAKKAPLILPDLDAEHFTPLKPPQPCTAARYGKDEKHVYYQYTPIANADAASFTALGEDYARDAKHVYYKDQVIAAAHPDSFSVEESGLAKDNDHVFYRTEGFAAASLRRLSAAYFALGPNVLYRGRKVDGADLSTFTPVAGDWARDKRWVFHGDLRAPQIDSASFQVLGSAFYGDKASVRTVMEVSNATDAGLPGVSVHSALPVEKSRLKAALANACKDASGEMRCLVEGNDLIAIVEIPQLGTHEVKAAPISAVKYSPEGGLQMGAEIFMHLKRVETASGLRAL